MPRHAAWAASADLAAAAVLAERKAGREKREDRNAFRSTAAAKREGAKISQNVSITLKLID